MTLEELLRRATDHPLVGAARADVDAAEARLMQTQWAPFSNWTASALFTIVPPMPADFEAGQGMTEDPQWNASILDWGPYVRLGFSGAIPIYTFGKISGAQDAAEAGVRAGRVGVERARQEVEWQVRRAYLTLLLARDILFLIDDGRGYIDDAREQVRTRIDRGEGGGSTIDLYKIDAMAAEVDARELQARRLEEVALGGLRLLAGLDEAAVIADVPLAPFALRAGPAGEYREAAGRERPEIRMLDAAIEAQEAKVGIERARYYPDLAVAGNVGFAWTNAAQDQHNPWIYDPLNYASYGLALVLECPFDFGMDYARVDEAEATLRRMRQQREALAQASLVEVDDAVAGLHEAGGRMEAWDRGRLAAKRWLIAVLQGMTLGLHEASDLTDALVAYFQNELNYLNAVYDYDMAWARLALTTGGHFLDGVEFVP